MGRRVLVEVPPQGDLGRGEAGVVGQGVGHPQVAYGSPVGGGLVIQGDGGQVAGEELPLAAGPVEARRAGAVCHRHLGTEAVEHRRRRQAQLGRVGVHGPARVQALPVGGAVARAVGLELKQLLLPLALLQLHDADLHVDTRGSRYTRKTTRCPGNVLK